MRGRAAAALVAAATLAACTTGGGSDDPAAASPDPTPSPTASPSPSASASPSPSQEPTASWEVGPADEYVSLAVAFVDDEDGDARRWAQWLGCDLPVNGSDSEFLHGCRVDTGYGRVEGVVVDWFSTDEDLDTSSAILTEALAGSSLYPEFCHGDAESVVSVSLAGGYVLVLFDPQVDAEVRYDTASDIDAAVGRAVAISGMDTPDDVYGVEVHRCE